jgi:acyl-CoA thioester hydrolase
LSGVLSVTVRAVPQFCDIDPMNVVWHGNYPRFLELGRTELLAKIGYGYAEMAASGYSWPVTEMTIRYIQPLRLGVAIDIVATLIEWENRLKISYEFRDAETGQRLTRATTLQVAVLMETGSLCWETPEVFRARLAPYLSSASSS